MAINPVVTKALCRIWSHETIEHLSAETAKTGATMRPNMEHVWSCVEDETTRKCLQDLTKPGAKLMWMATFTRNWVINLTEMGIGEATALKLARKMRKQIMQNTTDIWRTRNTEKENNKEKTKTITAMEETAEQAEKAGIIENAEKAVKTACEMHKREKNRKRWINKF